MSSIRLVFLAVLFGCTWSLNANVVFDGKPLLEQHYDKSGVCNSITHQDLISEIEKIRKGDSSPIMGQYIGIPYPLRNTNLKNNSDGLKVLDSYVFFDPLASVFIPENKKVGPNPFITLLSHKEDTGSYAAQNAFGAQFVVTTRKMQHLHIGFDLHPDLDRKRFITGRFSIKGVISDTGSTNHSLLLCGYLKEPYYYETLSFSQATFSKPTEVEIKNRFINFDLKRVLVVDVDKPEVITSDVNLFYNGN